MRAIKKLSQRRLNGKDKRVEKECQTRLRSENKITATSWMAFWILCNRKKID